MKLKKGLNACFREIFLLVLALLLGWKWAHWNDALLPEVEPKKRSSQAATKESKPEPRTNVEAVPTVYFPRDAIGDRVLVSFPDEESYQTYLNALRNRGDLKWKSLDALKVVRIGVDALRWLNPADYNGEVEFNYRLQHPKPPLELNPVLFESLTAYGATAREIAGGGLEGQGAGVVIAVLDSGIAEHALFEAIAIESNDWVKEDRTGLRRLRMEQGLHPF